MEQRKPQSRRGRISHGLQRSVIHQSRRQISVGQSPSRSHSKKVQKSKSRPPRNRKSGNRSPIQRMSVKNPKVPWKSWSQCFRQNNSSSVLKILHQHIMTKYNKENLNPGVQTQNSTLLSRPARRKKIKNPTFISPRRVLSEEKKNQKENLHPGGNISRKKRQVHRSWTHFPGHRKSWTRSRKHQKFMKKSQVHQTRSVRHRKTWSPSFRHRNTSSVSELPRSLEMLKSNKENLDPGIRTQIGDTSFSQPPECRGSCHSTRRKKT